jgi:sirohydrochlorin cobaltochelatase
MTLTPTDQHLLQTLEARLRILLPPEYQDTKQAIQPTSMGSAALKFNFDGRVAWNEIWATFCDLAMAGGPPHKGTLLQPATPAEIAAQPHLYQQVTDEICRGITLTTNLLAEPSPHPGWVRVQCTTHTMAAWLLRAITMENVAVRSHEGKTLDLPAGPAYRLETEIKNVITVIAKTCHYWQGHIPPAQQQAIATTLAAMDAETPLIQPTHGWQPLECETIPAAIRTMRLLVASNVLARRENATVFVPKHQPKRS